MDMGIYDRDYYRTPTRGGFAEFRIWSANTWIIIINVAVFLLGGILSRMLPSDNPYGPLYAWGSFSPASANSHWQVGRVMRFQCMHGSLSHIFFNILGLYFFGPIVEGQLGSRRYLGFYLFCGCAGALSYLILGAAGIIDNRGGLIGASAGIFGVLVAAAMIAPDMQITLLFPPIPMRLRTMAWIYLAFAVYSVVVMMAVTEAARRRTSAAQCWDLC